MRKVLLLGVFDEADIENLPTENAFWVQRGGKKNAGKWAKEDMKVYIIEKIDDLLEVKGL